jgi:hypothetical protein
VPYLFSFRSMKRKPGGKYYGDAKWRDSFNKATRLRERLPSHFTVVSTV